MGVFALVVLALVVFGVIAYVNYKREQARRTLLFQWATTNRWQFTVADDSWTGRWTGPPFDEGDHRRAANVVAGQWQGRQFVAFDYSFETHASNGKGGSTTTVHRFAVASLVLPASLPRLQVTPESLLSRVGHVFGISDIEMESEDFNRSFRVTCPDPKFASDVLPPRTMELLLGRSHVSWRVEGTDVVCWWGGEQTPSDVTDALTTMTDVVAGIPSFVWHDHGYDAGSAAVGGASS